MSKIFNFPERDVQALHRLQDLARVRAEALRDEAIADFWRGACALVSRGVSASQRSAQRFAARLRQHRKLRGQSPSDACSALRVL